MSRGITPRIMRQERRALPKPQRTATNFFTRLSWTLFMRMVSATAIELVFITKAIFSFPIGHGMMTG